MTPDTTEINVEEARKFLPELTEKYIRLFKKKEEISETCRQLVNRISKLEERNNFLEEQHENDELAIEYYKRAECPFYQAEGKCVGEAKKSDLKSIGEKQVRKKRHAAKEI